MDLAAASFAACLSLVFLYGPLGRRTALDPDRTRPGVVDFRPLWDDSATTPLPPFRGLLGRGAGVGVTGELLSSTARNLATVLGLTDWMVAGAGVEATGSVFLFAGTSA